MRQLSKSASTQRPGGNPFNRDAGTSGTLGAVHKAAADGQVASTTHNDVAALNSRRLSLPSKLADRLLAGIVPSAGNPAPVNSLRGGGGSAPAAVGAAGEYGDWTQSPAFAGLMAGGQRSVVQVPLAPGKAAFANADEFVATMLPMAQEAAQRIGVEPKVLVAQAALETGWGRSILRQSDGSSSHNLFNIKATGSWKGEQARALTSEFRDGQMVKESAAFRAYGSYAESFHDLANLLLNNDRYQEVVKSADNPEQFAAELQEAGYATDPNYARKISAIVRQLDKYQTYAANGTQTTL